jgi:hypothetical protein
MAIKVPKKLIVENAARYHRVDSLVVNPSNMLIYIRKAEYAPGVYITIDAWSRQEII